MTDKRGFLKVQIESPSRQFLEPYRHSSFNISLIMNFSHIDRENASDDE